MPLKSNRIHQGDCAQLLAKLEPGTVHLAFADPPFNIGYEYDVYDDRKAYDHYLDWSRQWMAGVHRALRPDGTFWLAIGDEYAAELKLIARDLGFSCRSWVIWYYTFGVNCTRKFNRSHAHLFHFLKDPKRFTFNFDDPAIRVPSARQLVYADARANPQGRLPDDTWILRPQDVARRIQRRFRHLVLPARGRHVQRTGRLPRLPNARTIARPHHSSQLERRRSSARSIHGQRHHTNGRQKIRPPMARLRTFAGLRSPSNAAHRKRRSGQRFKRRC